MGIHRRTPAKETVAVDVEHEGRVYRARFYADNLISVVRLQQGKLRTTEIHISQHGPTGKMVATQAFIQMGRVK